jgi:hypothetical protein
MWNFNVKTNLVEPLYFEEEKLILWTYKSLKTAKKCYLSQKGNNCKVYFMH